MNERTRASAAGAAGARSRAARPLRPEWLGRVAYADALAIQAERVRAVREGREPETLFLLEHDPVLTRGTGTEEGHLLASADELAALGIEVHDAGRGGDITYHGPGQLVGYPILDLKPDRQDLHRYLRDLEEVVIRTLARFGVEAGREAGLTGVWTGAGKIAAIGVRVSSGWITSHGFALNVAPDLAHFATIVPCGIEGRAVTSLARLLGAATPSVREVAAVATDELAAVFGRRVAG
ncbi:MAG: lipoyl(octanoyl) transferase LipB [Longimicrobiales bacterium]|nr:lipoyl(octanoyl) transferase LipB [Longimicrobiales bacterium]